MLTLVSLVSRFMVAILLDIAVISLSQPGCTDLGSVTEGHWLSWNLCPAADVYKGIRAGSRLRFDTRNCSTPIDKRESHAKLEAKHAESCVK
jgi:hypothetical protein